MTVVQQYHSLSLRERVGVRGVVQTFAAVDPLTLSLSQRERGLLLLVAIHD
jgi:hypothetical protein